MIRSCASSKRSRLSAGLTLLARALDAAAAHEAGDQTPARDHVDHRELFGQAQRVIDHRQRVAEHQDLGALGDLGQDRAGDVDRRLHAKRRRVVLVDHDAVEAGLVRDLVLLVVALVELAGEHGVEVGVGQGEAQGGVLLLQAGVVAGIGLLGEVVVLGDHCPTNPPMVSARAWLLRCKVSAPALAGKSPVDTETRG